MRLDDENDYVVSNFAAGAHDHVHNFPEGLVPDPRPLELPGLS